MILSTPVIFAATYYVDTASIGGTCSDSASGTSLVTPWCTVQRAATTTVAGDTVHVRAGLYKGQVIPLNSGTAGNVITYKNYNSENVTMSGGYASLVFSSLQSAETVSSSLFTDGFESNDTTFVGYNNTTVDAGNQLILQSGVVNHGQYAAAAVFGGTNRNARMQKTITTSPGIYQRMYFRINSAYDIIPNDSGQIIMNARFDSATNRGAVELLQNSGNQFYIRGRAVNPETGVYETFGTTAPGSIVPDTWYLLELRFKGGDALTGGAEVWLNGSSTGSIYTLDTSTTTISRVEFGGGTSGGATVATGSILYMDDVRVATSPIGVFSTGPGYVYKAAGVNNDPNYVFVDDVRLATSSDYLTMPSGSFYYDSVGKVIYIRLSDDGSPEGQDVDVPRYTTVFDITNKQHLTFELHPKK